ncbi:DNA-binding transcriptional regulator, GntR family [Asanoa hainanensis]|uniref:DNA-binding transcriptional regulator, GntR family n=1 Tax=Asanoa hainanensis TaxID=560556 RepID=A0A239N6F6_9ACTN|nr:GntR family transcriptional regulator [Asanoa hainanensis]SNT50521.1 DNA-binding transcriptional regulator, GntR family [Asanoa hainanensis]
MDTDLPAKIGAQHLPLRDQVLAALRKGIISGDYPPGERLTEDRLAEDFGVSRNPVREALRVAEAEGFVVILPRRGAVVASPSSATIHDIFAVRERLEPLAARLAAERAAPSDVTSLRGVLEQARQATENQNLRRVAELNSALHLQILEISGNPWLASIAKALYLHVQWVFQLTAEVRAPHSWDEHIKLVDAISSGDGDLAESVALAHVGAASAAARETTHG